MIKFNCAHIARSSFQIKESTMYFQPCIVWVQENEKHKLSNSGVPSKIMSLVWHSYLSRKLCSDLINVRWLFPELITESNLAYSSFTEFLPLFIHIFDFPAETQPILVMRWDAAAERKRSIHCAVRYRQNYVSSLINIGGSRGARDTLPLSVQYCSCSFSPKIMPNNRLYPWG